MPKCSEEKLAACKARRDWLKEHHICIQCGSREAVHNMVRCEVCLEYQHNRAVSKEKHNEYARLSRIKKKEQRICIYCTKPALAGYVMCATHKNRKAADNKKYYSYERKCTDEELHLIRSACGKENIKIALASPKRLEQLEEFRKQNSTMYGHYH